jgi:CheY-like chemotaxis protein
VPVVIVADDEAHIRAVVAAKLRTAGMSVFEARDGQEALDLARQHRADMVVSDLQMPFVSGLEMCQLLKQSPETTHTPALLITAREFIIKPEDLAKTNVRRVMSKPFSAREVLATVQDILKQTANERNAKAA